MKTNDAIIGAIFLLFLSFSSCRSNVDPASADREVRKLLRDVPGFDWELDQDSRLKYPGNSLFPRVPADDPISRKITKRIQDESAYEDGNKSVNLVGDGWQKSLPLDENGFVQLNLKNAMYLANLHSSEFQRQKEN